MKSFFIFLAVILQALTIISGQGLKCPCSEPAQCAHHYGHTGLTREVLVFSQGATAVQEWQWNTFNMLVAPSFFSLAKKEQVNVMCQTHANKRQFAVTVDMDLKGTINRSSAAAKAWVQGAVAKRQAWFADVVNVDLMPYFSDDSNSTDTDHMEVAHILNSLKYSLNNGTNSIKMMCVVPWKPACSSQKNSTCIFTKLSTDSCDFYVINPDSFLDDSNMATCQAGPTVSFSKLIFSFGEYLEHYVTFSQIILGVPWHGYDFECSRFESGVCYQKMLTSSSSTPVCEMNRKKLTLATIHDRYRDEVKAPKYNIIHHAPSFTYVNNSKTHQVWYENHDSLMSKYMLAIQLNLKGLAIMYVDDIRGYVTRDLLAQEGLMWTWLGHEVLLEKSQTHKADLHMADTVAGVAVGCLLLGTILGVTFTCLALRKRVRKPKPPPFMRDVDDYADEDPNL